MCIPPARSDRSLSWVHAIEVLAVAALVLAATVQAIHGASPSAEGRSVGSSILVSENDDVQHAPHVTYNPLHQEYFVVWHDEWSSSPSEVQGARVAADGRVLATFPISDCTNDCVLPVASYDTTRDRYLVVWLYDHAGTGTPFWKLEGRFVPWSGPVHDLEPFVLTSFTDWQHFEPTVAYSDYGDVHVVAFTGIPTEGPTEIHSLRCSGSGAGDTCGTVYVLFHGEVPLLEPDLSYHAARREFLLTWQVDGASADIWGARLLYWGLVVDPPGAFPIATWPDHEERPAHAHCPASGNYLVAWQSYQSAGHYDIYSRIVTGTGDLQGAPFHVTDSTFDDTRPDVACAGAGYDSYLVVWEADEFAYLTPAGVAGRLVEWSGMPFDTLAIEPMDFGDERTRPAAAGGPDGTYLVAWEHDRYGTAYQDVHARFVRPRHVFSDGFESGNWSRWSEAVP